MSNDEYPRIAVDRSKNSTDSGEIYERTLIVEIDTLASAEHGRRATFSYNAETETYSLESYEAVRGGSRRWMDDCLVFEPSDINVLERMAGYLERCDGGVAVEPFGGEERVMMSYE